VWVPDQSPGYSANAGTAVVGANEEVICWDIKKGELISRWSEASNNAQVTSICQSRADKDIFAVGYDDGKIRVWDSRTATVIIVFNGHKSAVTHLQFDDSGVRLASGSRDTDIILWDLIAEVGLFKLKGHKDQITSLNFLRRPLITADGGTSGQDTDGIEDKLGLLISTSKDALIKVWDLSLQNCLETHVAQSNGECWGLGLSPDHSGCISAGNDGELRVWAIDGPALGSSSGEQSQRILRDRGSFYRHGKDRTIGVSFHPQRDIVAIHGSEKAIELWRIRSESEIQRMLARKRKRRREKRTGEDGETADVDVDDKLDDVSTALVTEVFVPLVIVRTAGKVRSMDWAGGKSGKSVSILAGTTNNQLEVYNVVHMEQKPNRDEQPDYRRSFSVDMPGHRADVRCLALSSDYRMLASASHGSLKIWNVRTQSCIRTLDCGYALCTAFLPGDKIVVIGTRDGTLEIFDIASSTLLETIKAHERDIWSLQVHPDGKSLVTGSADKSAKFWDFRVVQEEVLGTARKNSKLTLIHTRLLKVFDDILAVRYSPDARLLAISTLDSTVKVFFTDSLKLFLTLYGHKLPVLSMDISYDSKLIVTSSADKNVRIWGLDFGDCHKAFFAHQDSIMAVAFVPNNNEGNGHHFFSASKDTVIKYYDGDKFEQIQKLDGHHGEIWAMAIAHSGEFLVSASHDKSIRIWQQTDEQLFLEEEREKELEELYENTMLTSFQRDDRDGVHDEEVAAAGKQTVETLMAGEKIAEALEIGSEDLELMKEYHKAKVRDSKVAWPQRNPVFLANNDISASAYVLRTFQRIPSASLQDALLVLSFSQLPPLFTFLALWADQGINIPLTCRILFFMLSLHQKQLVSSRLMRPLLEDVGRKLRATLQDQKGEMGFNLAGLRVAGRRVGEIGENEYVDEHLASESEKQSKKRGFINIA
jgi:U3 small nucleolar RNA-associated protein 12